MGICVSCDMAAEWAATAKVVLPTGELREYSPPATAAIALEEAGDGGEGCFLCDADAMGFEGFVAAVAGGEELRPGKIYFVLPGEIRRRRLAREEVAALAVKASAALVNAAPASTCLRRRRGAVAPLVFAPPEEATEQVPAVVVRKPAVVGKRRGRFAPDLTAIPEGE